MHVLVWMGPECRGLWADLCCTQTHGFGACVGLVGDGMCGSKQQQHVRAVRTGMVPASNYRGVSKLHIMQCAHRDINTCLVDNNLEPTMCMVVCK